MPKPDIPELQITDTFATWRSTINSWSSRLNDIKILEEGENIFESDPNAILRVRNGFDLVFIMNMLLDS